MGTNGLVSIYLLQIFNICYQFGKLALGDLSRWADGHIKGTCGNFNDEKKDIRAGFLSAAAAAAVLGPSFEHLMTSS